MIIEMTTLHAGTFTRSRVLTYSLDPSKYAAMHVEKRIEYPSDHRDGSMRQMHKELGDNLRAGFITLESWSNACGRKCRVPQ